MTIVQSKRQILLDQNDQSHCAPISVGHRRPPIDRRLPLRDVELLTSIKSKMIPPIPVFSLSDQMINSGRFDQEARKRNCNRNKSQWLSPQLYNLCPHPKDPRLILDPSLLELISRTSRVSAINSLGKTQRVHYKCDVRIKSNGSTPGIGNLLG